MKNKRSLIYDTPLNILTTSEMVDRLKAISYFRGEAGSFAGPARDMIERGLELFEAGLTTEERRRFGECLANVRTASAVKRSIRS